MARKNNNKSTRFVDENSVAARLYHGINGGGPSEEGLSSGLSKLVTGDYKYIGSDTTIIDNRKQTLAFFTQEDEERLFACGGSRFATFKGAIGKSEQMAVLKDESLYGSEYHITVVGEGANKKITFEE